jgi:hypothetical protein
MTATTRPGAGDWVMIWAQVKDGGGHPEDIAVFVESHNERYLAIVRRDRVMAGEGVPDFVRRCAALFEFAGGPNELLVRCEMHDGHGGEHRDASGKHHEDDRVVGHFEEVD